MKEEDYSNYGFGDLARDYSHDYNYVKDKVNFFIKLKKKFTLFQTIWSYLTAVLFIIYGIRWYVRTGEVLLTTVIFIVSAVYLIVTTALLLTQSDDKERKKKQSKVKKVFKYVSFAIKLTIITITLVSIVLGEETSTFTVIVSAFTAAWIMLSIAIDIAVFFINRTIKMLKELVEREARRAKAAFKNTAGAVKNGAGSLAQGAKELLKGIFKKSDDAKAKEETGESGPFEGFDD